MKQGVLSRRRKYGVGFSSVTSRVCGLRTFTPTCEKSGSAPSLNALALRIPYRRYA